jgi:hypothetical protein
MSNLGWLQHWYSAQCNGDWEHSNGVKIDTLDNPGWMLAVDLVGTSLQNKPFTPLNFDASDRDWMSVRVEDSKFKGAGDSTKLEKLIEVFRTWAEQSDD